MIKRKGIILAGALYPLVSANHGCIKTSFGNLYKPMIYYPLTVLMQAGIREILIITTPKDQEQFKYLLGSGAQWGIQLEYKIQPKPDGLAKAFILAENFLSGSPPS